MDKLTIYGILFFWIVLVSLFYIYRRKLSPMYSLDENRRKLWVQLAMINSVFTLLWAIGTVASAEYYNYKTLYFDYTFASVCSFGSTVVIIGSFMKNEKIIKSFLPLAFVGGLLVFVAPPGWWTYDYVQDNDFLRNGSNALWSIKYLISVNYHAFAFVSMFIYMVTLNWNIKKDVLYMFGGYASYVLFITFLAIIPYRVTNDQRWIVAVSGLLPENYAEHGQYNIIGNWFGGYPWVAIMLHVIALSVALVPLSTANHVKKFFYHGRIPTWQ